MTKEKFIKTLYLSWLDTVDENLEERKNYDEIISLLKQNNVDKKTIIKLESLINNHNLIGLKEGFYGAFEVFNDFFLFL